MLTMHIRRLLPLSLPGQTDSKVLLSVWVYIQALYRSRFVHSVKKESDKKKIQALYRSTCV